MLTSLTRTKNRAIPRGKRCFSRLWCLGILLPFAIPAAIAAISPAPEPVLQLTSTLKQPSPAPNDGTERALLRLEYRAGQSRADEKVLVENMIARLENMGRTVAELKSLIMAMPSERCPAATAPACPGQSDQPPAPTSRSGGLGADLYWLILAGSAVLLALLVLLWHRGRRESTENGAGETPFWHSDPATTPVHLNTTVAPADLEARATSRPPSASPPAAAVAPSAQSPAAPAAAGNNPPAAHEADQSLELAELMLSMRLTGSAAQTLENHIRSHPRQALIHWLKLLEIYRRSGQQKDFEASALQLQQHFNVAPPDWQPDAEPVPALRLPSLENYVHISSRIQELWPRRSCAEYLGRLLEDNRGGTRTGFPQNVAEEILFLLTLLRA